jgi:hypothetical protein
MKTKERLAQALHAEGLFGMEAKAREGYYDDYESPLATPIIQLVTDLREHSANGLAKRAMDGEFDGTKEESEAWFQKEGKHYVG